MLQPFTVHTMILKILALSILILFYVRGIQLASVLLPQQFPATAIQRHMFNITFLNGYEGTKHCSFFPQHEIKLLKYSLLSLNRLDEVLKTDEIRKKRNNN
jgi:hypothetical protein